MFRRGALKGCLVMSSEVCRQHLGLGNTPLLGGLDGLFVGLVPVRIPLRNPPDIFV